MIPEVFVVNSIVLSASKITPTVIVLSNTINVPPVLTVSVPGWLLVRLNEAPVALSVPLTRICVVAPNGTFPA